MRVPLLDIRQQNNALQEELVDAFRRVLASGSFVLGPEVEAFESEAASYLGTAHAIGMSSGTDALIVALMALDVGPGDEVLVPAFSFFASAGSVARLGATPVFVDVSETDFNLSVDDARQKVTSRTKAIMPVHLYGQSADMDTITPFAEEYGLAIVEDTAQSIGATYRGRRCGTFGEFGTFSFYPTKNLGALGDAGLLVTGDASLAERARQLRNHGAQRRYYHREIGGNFRLDAIQAAALRIKLAHLDTYAAARAANASAYIAALESVSPQTLIAPRQLDGREHVWNQFTIRVPGGGRDLLRSALAEAGIGSEVYYPLALHQQECFAGLPEHARSGCDSAALLASEVLSLPCYPELPETLRQEVVSALTRPMCEA